MRYSRHEIGKSLDHIEDMIDSNNDRSIKTDPKKYKDPYIKLPLNSNRTSHKKGAISLQFESICNEFSSSVDDHYNENSPQSSIKQANDLEGNEFLSKTTSSQLNSINHSDKDKLIQRQNEELLNFQIAYKSLELKYKGVKREFKSFKETTGKRIKEIDQELSDEFKDNFKEQLNAKQHEIEELNYFMRGNEKTIEALKKKLSINYETKTTAEQLDITELKEMTQSITENIKMVTNDLEIQKKRHIELSNQVKSLIYQFDDYTENEKLSASKNDLITGNKELKENIMLMKRENEGLKHQIVQWENILDEYRKYLTLVNELGVEDPNVAINGIKEEVSTHINSIKVLNQ